VKIGGSRPSGVMVGAAGVGCRVGADEVVVAELAAGRGVAGAAGPAGALDDGEAVLDEFVRLDQVDDFEFARVIRRRRSRCTR